jgi:hypothetical protein
MVSWLLVIKVLGTCKYPLDATLMGLDMIHDSKTNKWWCNTKIDSGCPIASRISVASRWIWTWNQFHWKFYLLIFPMSSRTTKLDVVCDLGISFNMDSS